jgi:hypothetical protein
VDFYWLKNVKQSTGSDTADLQVMDDESDEVLYTVDAFWVGNVRMLSFT